MPGEDRRQNSPQSVTRVIRILEMLSATPAPIGLAELSRALGTPKSSLAALLRGLADEEFVVSSDGMFRLGPGAFGLGSALTEARRRVQSPELVRAGLRRLAERTGETALFAVRDRDGATLTYVDSVESRNAVRFAVSVGDRRPLYATAGGRMLLSGLSDANLAAYLNALKPEAITPRTETSKTALAEAINAARAAGVAQTVDQAGEGVTGTAALVRDASGTVLGAMIVAAPSARLQDRRDDLAQLVKDEAAAISRSLGWRQTEV